MKAELEFRLAFHQRIEQSVRSTLSALRPREGVSPFVTLPDTVIGWAYVTPTTQLSLGTLDGLIQSGRLSILRDAELRNALAGWAGVLGELTEEELRSRDYLDNHLDPVLRSRVNLSPFVNTPLWNLLLAGDVTAPEFAGESRLPVDLEMIGVFSMRLALIQHGIDEFKPVQDEVSRILDLIGQSIAR